MKSESCSQMRFLYVFVLILVVFTAQGAGHPAVSAGLAYEAPPVQLSLFDHGDHQPIPHHCAKPCQLSAHLLRVSSATRVGVKKASRYRVFSLPSAWLEDSWSKRRIGGTSQRAGPERYGNAASFRAVYARTGRLHL